MPRVVHFEIGAKDPEVTNQFYTNVFGWTITKWDGPQDYWLVDTGDPNEPGINGGIARVSDMIENTSIVNTIDVDDIDACIATIKQHNGKVVADKMPIPGMGYLAYCKDPGGALFGIMQRDSSAQ